MQARGLLALSAFLIGALAIVAVAAGQALPADVRLPMHWDAMGEIDGWGSKWVALLAPVALGTVISLILAGAGRFVPRGDAMERSAGLIQIAWLGTIGLAWTIELMVLAVAFHWPVAPVRMLLIAMGLFFAALGNQFGKSRPMWLVGIRTPWTMDDPDVWIATHRLGGKLFVLAGSIWLAAGLFGFYGPRAMPVLVAVILVAALVPAAWSYVLWRRKRHA
jgi:uncharacterized membrane protein